MKHELINFMFYLVSQAAVFLDVTQPSPKRGSVAWHPKNGWEGDYVLPESSPARILSYAFYGAFSDFSWLVAVLETDSSENSAATLFSLIWGLLFPVSYTSFWTTWRTDYVERATQPFKVV